MRLLKNFKPQALKATVETRETPQTQTKTQEESERVCPMSSFVFTYPNFPRQKGNVPKGNVSFYRFQLPFSYRTNSIGTSEKKKKKKTTRGHRTQTAKKVTAVRTARRPTQGHGEGRSKPRQQLVSLPKAAARARPGAESTTAGPAPPGRAAGTRPDTAEITARREGEAGEQQLAEAPPSLRQDPPGGERGNERTSGNG